MVMSNESVQDVVKIEKPTTSKPEKSTTEVAPQDLAKQKMISRIERGGDDDQILSDIANGDVSPTYSDNAQKQNLNEKQDTTSSDALGNEELLEETQVVARSSELKYDYTFPDGKKFVVIQQEDGTASLSLARNGETIFNFSELLPDGYIFITKDYIQQFNGQHGVQERWVGWVAYHKYKHIQIGDFETPKDIVDVLHEIGHAQNYTQEESKPEGEQAERSLWQFAINHEESEEGIDFSVAQEKEITKLQSKSERNAWAFALRAVRDLEGKGIIDLNLLFNSFDDLKDLVDAKMATYKESSSWLIREDPTFETELRALFDKGRLPPKHELLSGEDEPNEDLKAA